jgi:HPt (histidine-containing phosphotransfer) domain-containing protein
VADTGIIDIEALKERVHGDADLLVEITGIFLDRYPESMAKIREAIASRNAKNLEASAHHLRGYLVTFHAKEASYSALELEIKGRHNDWLYVEELQANLEHQMALLVPILSSLVPAGAICQP